MSLLTQSNQEFTITDHGRSPGHFHNSQETITRQHNTNRAARRLLNVILGASCRGVSTIRHHTGPTRTTIRWNWNVLSRDTTPPINYGQHTSSSQSNNDNRREILIAHRTVAKGNEMAMPRFDRNRTRCFSVTPKYD